VSSLPQPAGLVAALPLGLAHVPLGPCRACGRVYPQERLICPTDDTLLPLEGRLLDGKFRLERRVGDGGMASVWQATNTLVHRTVAIKLMHARYASDSELLSRFRNEASAAGRIGSPHICDVLDFGQSEIGPYIVLELLEGCSLAELIHAHRRLDHGLAVWIVRQALLGLEAAHRAGIVHRDLKPENIFLCRAYRGQWLVKLMDFGISKFAHQFQTAANATMGTPHYMAPEQIHGAARVDARADLWSIGVILYEAITSVQVFARDSVADALAALRGYDPPPLTEHAPDAPRGLAEVIARCLQRPPERRHASAQALHAALAPFERPPPDGDPASSRRPPSNPMDLPRAGVQPPLPRDLKRTGPQAPVPQDRRTGPQATVPATAKRAGPRAPVPQDRQAPAPAKRTGPQAPVPQDRQAPAPAAKRTGPQATVPAAKRTGPQAIVPAGPRDSAAVPKDRRTGPQAPVSRAGPDRARTGPQAPVSRAPVERARTGPQAPVAARAPAGRTGPAAHGAWLWGVLLALLGGLLVLAAALLRG
jgi:serine/threonine protein kinase